MLQRQEVDILLTKSYFYQCGFLHFLHKFAYAWRLALCYETSQDGVMVERVRLGAKREKFTFLALCSRPHGWLIAAGAFGDVQPSDMLIG